MEFVSYNRAINCDKLLEITYLMVLNLHLTEISILTITFVLGYLPVLVESPRVVFSDKDSFSVMATYWQFE